MNKYLTVILSLLSVTAYAETTSVEKHHDYPQFIESSIDMRQHVLTLFDPLIPLGEKKHWTVISEQRGWEEAHFVWQCDELDRISWISLECGKTLFSDLSKYLQETYVDDEGFTHTFSSIDNWQFTEEVFASTGLKMITVRTIVSDLMVVFTYETYDTGTGYTWNARKFDWEAIRELWLQRWMNLDLHNLIFTHTPNSNECEPVKPDSQYGAYP